MPHLRGAARGAASEVVLCGDWNIAHQRDRPEELAQQPEELGLPARGARLAHARVRRAWAASTCSAALDPRPEQYTWWSNRGQAWAKNVGWRIDYQIATPGHRGDGARGVDLQGAALLRPRAADRRLRLRPRGATPARANDRPRTSAPGRACAQPASPARTLLDCAAASTPATGSGSSAPTAAASRACSRCCAASCTAEAGDVELPRALDDRARRAGNAGSRRSRRSSS
ncbi:MAG: endonuclease/exonuclease/phosphatase family protein [Comamonadaceae bacterium]|nr:endonuclease/exonuclease/phosphatase family protein [Comamonadaceae bacterium]